MRTLEAMEVTTVDEQRSAQDGELTQSNARKPRKVEFREIDTGNDLEGERYLNGLRKLVAKLTPQERLLGKVDEEGAIVWSGNPRAMHERTRRRVDAEAADE